MDSETIATFAQSLRGALIGRDAADYDEARKLYNGMIDKRPLMIARCVDVADVVTAVNFARENGLLVAVRGGQRPGPRQLRRRAGDRPVADEGGAGRSGDADRARRAGVHLGRRRPRHPRVRPGGSVRDCLVHRGRRADAGRRHRLPLAQARADDRQPARGRRGSGGRQYSHGEQGSESGPVLGPARRRRQFRGGDELPVPGAPSEDGLCGADLLGREGCGRDHARLS